MQSAASCQAGSQPCGSQPCRDTLAHTSGHPPPPSPPASCKNLPLLRAVHKSDPIFCKGNQEEVRKKGKRGRAHLKHRFDLPHDPHATWSDPLRFGKTLPWSLCLKYSCSGFSSYGRVKWLSSSLLTVLLRIIKTGGDKQTSATIPV